MPSCFQFRVMERVTHNYSLVFGLWTFSIILKSTILSIIILGAKFPIHSISCILSFHFDHRLLESMLACVLVCAENSSVTAAQSPPLPLPPPQPHKNANTKTDQRRAKWMDNNFIKEIKCKRRWASQDIAGWSVAECSACMVSYHEHEVIRTERK